MNLKLTDHNRGYLEAKIESGEYPNTDVAINEAIALLEHRDENLKEVRRPVEEARQSITRGEGLKYTPELMRQIEMNAIEAAAQGKPVSAHVRP